jgi:hypothetical protein
MATLPCNSSDSNFKADFIELSERLAMLAAKDGLRLTPYEDPELPHFSLLSPTGKARVLASLESDCRLCAHVQTQGFKARDARALTWKMIRFLGVSPTSDVLGLIEQDDMVEIYSAENILLFASLNFFEEVSYSLEDIYCRSWMDLFWRAAEPANALAEYARKIISGEVRETLPIATEPHYVEETKTGPEARAWILRNKYFAPIYEKNVIAGFICINAPLVRTPKRRR